PHDLNLSMSSSDQGPSQGMSPASSRSRMASAFSLTSAYSQRSNAHSISVRSYSRNMGLMSCSKPANRLPLLHHARGARLAPTHSIGGRPEARPSAGRASQSAFPPCMTQLWAEYISTALLDSAQALLTSESS